MRPHQIKKNKHGKIPLPWAVEENRSKERADLTRVYWHMSHAWNNTPKAQKGYTVGDVLQDAGAILSKIDPNAPLAIRVCALKDDVIQHGTKSVKTKHQKANNSNTTAKSYVL